MVGVDEFCAGAFCAGAFWVRGLAPLVPHAAAPTPSIASRAIGAILRDVLRRITVVVGLMAFALLVSVMTTTFEVHRRIAWRTNHRPKRAYQTPGKTLHRT